jgi:hypothetical protein
VEEFTMKYGRLLAISVCALIFAINGFADDQQKAEKMLHRVSAMATDATGRRVVSMTVADTLGAKRPDLVVERRSMNLSYGDLFIVHSLVKSGAKMDDIAAQLKDKRSIDEIAAAQHADWKQIASDAKKLNAKMEDNLYKHFVNEKPDIARDRDDSYDPNVDGVPSDNSVSKQDIAEAQDTYQMWRERAAKNQGVSLDTSTEKSAREMRGDPIGKAPQTDSKTTAPN